MGPRGWPGKGMGGGVLCATGGWEVGQWWANQHEDLEDFSDNYQIFVYLRSGEIKKDCQGTGGI